MPKRKISGCSGRAVASAAEEAVTDAAGAVVGVVPAPAVDASTPAAANNAAAMDALVKRLRRLEQENAQLRARVVSSEANVHTLAEHLASRKPQAAQQLRQQQRAMPQHWRRPVPLGMAAATAASGPASCPPSHKVQPAPVSPRLVPDAVADAAAAGAAAAAASAVARGERGASRQRITSPRQFYLTLLAMYCSAFAHIMHGPDSKHPILSRAAAQHERERFQQQQFLQHTSTFPTKSSTAARAHGIASAEADMCCAAPTGATNSNEVNQKYARMLRASSHGLLRLIQFRRKIVRDRERSRRAAAAAAAVAAGGPAKFDPRHHYGSGDGGHR